MKFYILKIIIILFLFIEGCADRSLFTEPGVDPGLGGTYTKISGELSDTLFKNNSPYLVTNNITVNSGSILLIEAGTQIFFKENTSFYIYGGLRALGNKENIIVFRAFEEGWEGIHSSNPADSLVFMFCTIQDVYLPHESVLKFGAIETTNANVQIKNCYFYYNYTQYGGALALSNTNSEISNNIFYFNDSVVYGGAILSQNSSNKIINNTFYRNFCLNFGGGLVLIDPVSEDIQNNIFFDNFSYLGDPRIHLVSGDSTNVIEQYNFLAFGEMNPLFKFTNDFHLSENSPCKDSGNPAIEFNDTDNSRNDQGAYGGPGGDW